MSTKAHKAKRSNANGHHPEGIIVLDHLPTPLAPQLRAFVWCRSRVDHASFGGARVATPAPVTLMVGLPGRSLTDDRAWAGNRNGTPEE